MRPEDKGTLQEQALALHRTLHGKIKVESTFDLDSQDTLSLVYSPGVGAVSEVIAEDKDQSFDLTWRGNTVAIISDGSAVLGLGNIGAEAALPVMEGKALLLKEFGNVNAVPLVINTQDVDEIVQFCTLVAPSFGGINLEDISAPRCVEIERRVQENVDIPVFHDDQHGTAIVVLAALHNALKLTNRSKDVKVVVNGAGAAGSAIIRLLHEYGIHNIYAYDHNGLISAQNTEDSLLKELQGYVVNEDENIPLETIIKGADVFIGVSVANILTQPMVRSMAKQSIVFALANPDPEITYDDALEAGAYIVGTGRSDRPNQINNLLVFPGLFNGLLHARARTFPKGLKLEVALALAALSEDTLTTTSIIPSVFDKRVCEVVSNITQTYIASLK